MRFNVVEVKNNKILSCEALCSLLPFCDATWDRTPVILM